MTTRDEFALGTKRELAGRVAYACSRPGCPIPTIGPARAGSRAVVVGDAAHITAAAPNGPRFNPDLTPAERKAAANGIWLCKLHATQVDSDDKSFPVELLQEWKTEAEKSAFNALTTGRRVMPRGIEPLALEDQILELLGLKTQNLDELVGRMHAAALSNIGTFKAQREWPAHAIGLSLRQANTTGATFDAVACAQGLQATRELVIVAPPGTGKSTTGVQVIDAMLADDDKVAIFVPLNEWSKLGVGRGSILSSLSDREAFMRFRAQDFMYLAHQGRLSLVLDGWNELDAVSRQSANLELKRLRREYPLLELVVTTRRQTLEVPIGGPRIQIEGLSEAQQLELAAATAGTRGEELLERAWRTPGLRELLTVPLYLRALLTNTPAGHLPTTKEEILRLFVKEHEAVPEAAEVLHAGLKGQHDRMLIGLASEASNKANTAISEATARAVVAQITTRLIAEGQVSHLEPASVIELLVNHHTLVRTPELAVVSFRHEQIQEWYASYEVEELLKAARNGNAASAQRLGIDILNVPAWEEPVLFACERLSRSGEAGAAAVADGITQTLVIDPILAAEMIYRSSQAVWDKVARPVISFAERWHVAGKVDRAVRFMLTIGRPEFSEPIWALLTNAN
jgi:hypothetical protein